MSVSACEVVQLTLLPSGLSLFHQVEGATATPCFTRVEIRATSLHSPRSFRTLTVSPSDRPRRRASSSFISIVGVRSPFRIDCRCENELLRNVLAAGLSNWIGYRAASSGEDSGDSRGGMNAGKG